MNCTVKLRSIQNTSLHGSVESWSCFKANYNRPVNFERNESLSTVLSYQFTSGCTVVFTQRELKCMLSFFSQNLASRYKDQALTLSHHSVALLTCNEPRRVMHPNFPQYSESNSSANLSANCLQ